MKPAIAAFMKLAFNVLMVTIFIGGTMYTIFKSFGIDIISQVYHG